MRLPTTTRLHRDGSLGHTYRMHITGPDTCIRIEDLGPGTAPGTAVRLLLRPDTQVSALETLRELIRVAPFPLTVTDRPTTAEQRWEPGTLVRGWNRGMTAGFTEVPVPGEQVWWVDGQGEVLSEGITAGQNIVGAVVDLCGPHAPTLSVDRTKMLAYDRDRLRVLLERAVPAAVAHLAEQDEVMDISDHRQSQRIGGIGWYHELARRAPEAADAVWRGLAAAGPRVVDTKEGEYDQSRAGVVPRRGSLEAGAWSARVRAWQVSAQLAAGWLPEVGVDTARWPEIPPVLPSDERLLFPWGSSSLGVDAGTLSLAVAQVVADTGRPVTAVCDRWAELGFEVSEALRGMEVTEADSALLENNVVRGAVRAPGDGVPTLAPVAVHQVAATLRRPAHEVAERLRAWGFRADVLPGGTVRLTRAQLVATSKDRDAVAPWLSVDEPLAPARVVVAALQTRSDPRALIESLVRIGYRVQPIDDAVLDSLGQDDLRLVSRDLDGQRPFLDQVEVAGVHVAKAAETLVWTVEATVERFRGFGFEPAAPVTLAAVPHPAVARVRPTVTAAGAAMLAVDKTVPLAHVVMTCEALDLTEQEVRDSLTGLGYRVADPVEGGLDPVDLLLASEDQDTTFPVRAMDEPITISGLCDLASQTYQPPADVAARMPRMGYQVDVDPQVLPLLDRTGQRLASRDGDGADPWRDPADVVDAAAVVLLAARAELTVGDVLDRLQAMGFTAQAPREVLPVTRPGQTVA